MIYHSLYTDFIFKRLSLFLPPPPPPLLCIIFFSQTLFFRSSFFLQLLLPTFEVTSRPFRPSVIFRRIGSSRIEAGKEHFCRRKRERKSPGAFESSGCTPISCRRTECTRRIKCRMTNVASRARGTLTGVSRL